MNSSSAKTSLNQVSALHKCLLNAVSWECTAFDFGAGKKGKIDAAFEEKGVAYFPYDPFCRTLQENNGSKEALDRSFVDRVTCANVLNIIPDADLDTVIQDLVYFAKKTHCRSCWISVYHNPRLGPNLQRKGYVQRNQPIEWYMPHLLKHFKTVTINKGKFLCCRV